MAGCGRRVSGSVREAGGRDKLTGQAGVHDIMHENRFIAARGNVAIVSERISKSGGTGVESPQWLVIPKITGTSGVGAGHAVERPARLGLPPGLE